MQSAIQRTPWGDRFPDVLIHGNLFERNRHPAFEQAKSGDADAAFRFVRAFWNHRSVAHLRDFLGGESAIILPVTAIEAMGFNAIPDAMAHELSRCLNLPLSIGEIVQSNRVSHTRAAGWHRLVTPAVFSGTAICRATYVLVDDHVGFGGTLANLREHIEAQGGRVLGMVAVTETGGGREIAGRPETLSRLRSKHGNELEALWYQTFGYGLDCLTNIEAGYLSRVESVDAIRDRLAEAAELARRRGASTIDVG